MKLTTIKTTGIELQINDSKRIIWMSDWTKWPKLYKAGLIRLSSIKGNCYGHTELYLIK